MDIGILAVLTTIYNLAEKCGLLAYIKKLPEKTADALYEKLVQDTDFEKYIKNFFPPEMERKFESALKKIGPVNKSIKRRFLLVIFADPAIVQVIGGLSKGHLPERAIFIPIFQRWLSKDDVEENVNAFVDTLYFELRKDQEFVNLVILSMYELMGQQHQQLIDTIQKALEAKPQLPKAKKRLKIETSKLPITSAALYGRDAELELLNKAWDNPKTKIVSFVAWGGVGKSALVNDWLNQMAEKDYKGAELVYGWSFYSQGTKEKGQASADGFINDAFKWFGYTGEMPKSQHERGRLLAEVIARQKTLLILDGLEPLQYPPGEMNGFLKDATMSALLKNLARNMNGLCIITSRCKVEDLRATEGRLSQTYDLENLSPEAGMAILKSYKLRGKDSEFIETSKEFEGHALALHLAGSYLKTYHEGDIKQRSEIPKLTEDEKQGGHARRVMASYEKWFAEKNRAELDVLYLLGLFDRPAAKEAIDVLKQEPAIPGLTERLQKLSRHDWQTTLNHLRDLHLIAQKDTQQPDTLDCHPLIREHFGDKLQKENPAAWKEAHTRLYDYYKNLPEKELPDTLEEMEPLFAAVMHGCLAGKHQETLDYILWKRIKRENEHYIYTKLGAFGADLACLSNFFDSLWDKPVSGLTTVQAVTLNWAGVALRAVGRLSEAVEPMKAGMEESTKNKDWKGAAQNASNLSELYLTLGDVASAQKYGEQCVIFADRSDDTLMKLYTRTTHADALHQSGKIKPAEKLFLKADGMQKKRQPEYSFLYSFQGFRFCDLLLSIEKVQEALNRAQKALDIVLSGSKRLLDIALNKLTIGKALMLQFITNPPSKGDRGGCLAESENYLNQAVDGLRESGNQDELPRGLFARAAFSRHQHDFLNSWTDLDEANEIAKYGGMRLYLTDYHLEACRVIKEQLTMDSKQFEIIENGETISLSKEDMQAKFHEHFRKAERLIKETGYHRRNGELDELRG